MTQYISNNTPPIPFLQYPRFLQELKLNGTCKTMYALFYDRAMLSKRNGWTDEEGNVFIIYTVKDLAGDLSKTETTVKRCMKTLEQHGLISKVQQGANKANLIYVKIPEEVITNDAEGDGKLTVKGAKNVPLRGAKMYPPGGQKCTPNNNNITRTKEVNYYEYDCEGNSL